MLDFLLPEIDKDRDESVAGGKIKKERPAGAAIDKEDAYWKGEIENSLKEAGLKPTKNSREQLTGYISNVLSKVQGVSDGAINADQNKKL